MSDPDRPITGAELKPLLAALAQFFEGSGPAFQALFHQARANTLVCALLVRELTKAGLIEPEALKKEALAAAETLEPPGSGAGVVNVITGIFGGKAPEIPPQVVLRVIQGGLDRARAPGDREPDKTDQADGGVP